MMDVPVDGTELFELNNTLATAMVMIMDDIAMDTNIQCPTAFCGVPRVYLYPFDK
jgi:hypothetical protein